ncbi:integrase [Salinibacter ruber]|uniref:site-specific integrase n=1 Tax=Salinibacter ruber TaxID=146919 RepID=UPI0021696C68|nr:site-specific integrase [Salinibacter ruber]MCS3955344.1 integrase [Salinibacter ruber]
MSFAQRDPIGELSLLTHIFIKYREPYVTDGQCRVIVQSKRPIMSSIEQYSQKPFYAHKGTDESSQDTETTEDIVVKEGKHFWIEFDPPEEPFTDTSRRVLRLVRNVEQHRQPGYCTFSKSLFVERNGNDIFKPYRLYPTHNFEDKYFSSAEVKESASLYDLSSLKKNEIRPTLERYEEALKAEVLTPLRNALIPCMVEVYRREIGFESEPEKSLRNASYSSVLSWGSTLRFTLRLWDRIVSGQPLAQVKSEDWFEGTFEKVPSAVSQGARSAIRYYVSDKKLSRDYVLAQALPVYFKWAACREAIQSKLHEQKTDFFAVDTELDKTHVLSGDNVPAKIKKLLEEAAARRKDALSENTIQAYQHAIDHFKSFCERHGPKALPASPETLIAYFEHLAQNGYAESTIRKRRSAIRFLHERSMNESPTTSESVRRYFDDLRKTIPESRGHGQKDPILFHHLHQMSFDEEELSDLRDRAILYIGVATGLRDSGLIGLEMRDIFEKEGGVVYRIRDPKGEGDPGPERVSVPHEVPALDPSPNEALTAWIEAAGIESGAVFRSVDQYGNVGGDDGLSSGSISKDIVKPWMKSIGEDPSEYSCHSLRAGFVTQAILDGITEPRIAAQSRHKSIEALREYERPTNDMKNHMLKEMG